MIYAVGYFIGMLVTSFVIGRFARKLPPKPEGDSFNWTREQHAVENMHDDHMGVAVVGPILWPLTAFIFGMIWILSACYRLGAAK